MTYYANPIYLMSGANEYLMSDKEYRLKLDALYLDMNTSGTSYTGFEQDFIDSFYASGGDLAISPSDFSELQKNRIVEIWNIHIKED